jgi:hypothetical protein
LNFSFSPSGGTYNLVNDPGSAVIWTGGGTIDVTAILTANGITSDVATRVDVSLDNVLATTSENGTISHIKKKQIGGVTFEATPGGTPTPEPTSLAILAAGGLVLLRRRHI